MDSSAGAERLRVVNEGFKRLQEQGFLRQPSPPVFEWRWSPESGIGAFATQDIEPMSESHIKKAMKPGPGFVQSADEIEQGLVFATKASVCFGGRESQFQEGNSLKKKQKEEKESESMIRSAMMIYAKEAKEEPSEGEKMQFRETGMHVFSFFLRKFTGDPEPWMEEYTKMLPQPDGSVGKEYGGVGGVGFVYEFGEKVLEEKFAGTSLECYLVYGFARAYTSVIRKFMKMGNITKFLESQNLTLEQYVLYVMSQCESRTFQGHGWIPFIDFVNGTMAEGVWNLEKQFYKLNFKGKVLDKGAWHFLRVSKPVKKGEELIIDYGSTYSDMEKNLSGVLIKYGAPDLTGFRPGRDVVTSVRLDIAQVYPSFLPLQKQFLKKYGMFGEEEAKVGVWLAFPPPPFINIQVIDPSDPFIRQLAITVSVTDEPTLRSMVQTGRLRVPHLSIDDLINSLRAFISATLAGPTFRKQSTEHFVSIWEDVSLPFVDRCVARLKAAEREALLIWDHALCRALPDTPFANLRPQFALMDNIKRCKCCGRSYGLFRCTRCKEVLYCGVNCQKVDWKGGHKAKCRK